MCAPGLFVSNESSPPTRPKAEVFRPTCSPVPVRVEQRLWQRASHPGPARAGAQSTASVNSAAPAVHQPPDRVLCRPPPGHYPRRPVSITKTLRSPGRLAGLSLGESVAARKGCRVRTPGRRLINAPFSIALRFHGARCPPSASDTPAISPVLFPEGSSSRGPACFSKR